jgi:hypothetical protein
MRVWVVDDRRGEVPPSLVAVLRQAAEGGAGRLALLGSGPYHASLPGELRGCPPDLLLLHEPSWPEGPELQEVLEAGIGVVVATSPERTSRFLALAETYPVWLLPPTPGPDELRLALHGALAAQRRQAYWKNQVVRLQQRLGDRVVIERAKGLLVQRLGISEEEAYKRLRLLSRRQRRQIRDIAQALIDAGYLLLPELNGFAEPGGIEVRPGNEGP